jgi:acetyl esterase/lipase
MRTITAAVLLSLVGFVSHAQEKTIPVGEQLVYKTVDGQALHLWVARPTGTPTRTAIVFFHGGGWTGGDVTQFNPQTKQLAQRGMLVVNVQYRLVAKAPSTESVQVCLEDAKSAMRWVRSHAKDLGIDPDKIIGRRISGSGDRAGSRLG